MVFCFFLKPNTFLLNIHFSYITKPDVTHKIAFSAFPCMSNLDFSTIRKVIQVQNTFYMSKKFYILYTNIQRLYTDISPADNYRIYKHKLTHNLPKMKCI